MPQHPRNSLYAAEILLFDRIAYAVKNLPNPLIGDNAEEIEITSPKLARAVGYMCEGLRVVDGFYNEVGFSHSWLETINRTIIDVWPYATLGGPLMIDTRIFDGLFIRTYVPVDDPTLRTKFNTTKFRRDVMHIRIALQKKQANLPI